MENQLHGRILGEAKLSKLVLQYSIPCVLSLMVGALYNIVDQIFIGNSSLSTLGNAATGVCFPFFIIAQAFAWCFGDGCSTFLNISQGKNDTGRAHRAIGSSFTLIVIVSLILMGVFFASKEKLLTLFGASERSLPMAIEYFNIILIFFPVLMLSNMSNAIIRADGDPAYAMIAMLTGAVINIVLDPIFIFGLKWGMTGAALATVLGQLGSFIMVVRYLRHPKTFSLDLKSFIPDFHAFFSAVKIGIPTFITQITILLMTVVCNMTLSKYGALSPYGSDIPIAVIGISTKVFTVVINIVVAIVLGCQPIISYNMGAEKYDRVKSLYKIILRATIIIGLVATFLFEVTPDIIIRLFGTPKNIPNPGDYWDFARKTFRIYLMLVTFNTIVKVNSLFLQSVGKPVESAFACVIRDVIFFIPLAFILPLFMGVEGVLVASPVADFVSFIITTVLMKKFMKSLDAN